MTGRTDARLNELGIVLPLAPAPVANYVPFVISGGLLFISGQVPLDGGTVRHVGSLGGNLSIEEGQEAARLCAVNILAQAKSALNGDLDRIVRCVKLGGFVSSTPAFRDHPKIINAASDLMVAVLGDAGRHARFAVGAPSLPLGSAVEIEAIFEIR
ncbi:MAG: RidA family protein [Alphaproteobacteria bacterium]